MAPGVSDKVGRGLGVRWGEGGVGVQMLTVPHREGRRGQLQVDGEEPVSGESPGSNVMANTEGSIYVGTVGHGDTGVCGGKTERYWGEHGGDRLRQKWTQGGYGMDVEWAWNGRGVDVGETG